MKVQGQCHCGAIAFEAEVDPSRASICHCTDCQVLSGTAYRATVPASAESFVLERGQPNTYVKVAESGRQRLHAFCGRCGTPIYATSVTTPTIYSLRIGTLAQRQQIVPTCQIWCRSALPWSHALDGLPREQTQ